MFYTITKIKLDFSVSCIFRLYKYVSTIICFHVHALSLFFIVGNETTEFFNFISPYQVDTKIH